MGQPTEPGTISAARPSVFWRRACRLLVGLVIVRGVALVCIMPPFEGWDEYQHVGYVERMRQGEGRPVLGEATVPAALLARVVEFPQPHSVLGDGLARLGAVGYAEFWAQHDPRDPRSSPPAFRDGTRELYQAQHGPLYSRLAAPLFAALGGANNLRSSVAGLRLVNVALTAAAVALVLGLLRRITHSERIAALLVLPLAAHPLFLLNGARVANDALGVLLATAAVGLGIALALGQGRAGRRASWCALGLGVAIGLAAQAKATNLALVPFAAACWLAYVVRERRQVAAAPVRALLVGIVLAGGFLAVEFSDLRFNFTHYGSPTAMQEALINRRNGRTSADLLRTAATFHWGRDIERLWSTELFFKGGWSFLRTAVRATLTYQFLVKLGLIGWAVWGLRRLALRLVPTNTTRQDDGPVFVAPAVPCLLAVLVLCYTAALAYHMVQSKLAWGIPTTCPWYACPALPWFLALVTAGGRAYPLGRLREALPWSLAAAGLAGEFVGLWGWMVPTYAAGADGLTESLRRLSSLQPSALGTSTLLLALAAEVTAVAALVLVFRDAARSGSATPIPSPAKLLRGPHVRTSPAASPRPEI
jgi:4-amino-4-deoxy-L-arabinose transferase-like glycosyltransferase